MRAHGVAIDREGRAVYQLWLAGPRMPPFSDETVPILAGEGASPFEATMSALDAMSREIDDAIGASHLSTVRASLDALRRAEVHAEDRGDEGQAVLIRRGANLLRSLLHGYLSRRT